MPNSAGKREHDITWSSLSFPMTCSCVTYDDQGEKQDRHQRGKQKRLEQDAFDAACDGQDRRRSCYVQGHELVVQISHFSSSK